MKAFDFLRSYNFERLIQWSHSTIESGALKAICNDVGVPVFRPGFLGPFGITGQRLSFLQEFLEFASTDEQYTVGFSCLHTKIAEDVAFSVKYLHENDIVHRDFKPGNVLISNQDYSHLDQGSVKEEWSKVGIVCKLVDFQVKADHWCCR